jgi:hypothetical protein
MAAGSQRRAEEPHGQPGKMDGRMTAVGHVSPGMASRAVRPVTRRGRDAAAPPDLSKVRHVAFWIAVAILSLLSGGLATLGGIGSFATVRHLAVPWFGASSAWIAPVGIDIGILVLLGWDLLAEFLAMPWPVLRWVAWTFIGGTVYLNVAAAHGNPVGSVMHAAMPSLFIVATEGIRHLARQLTGLANGTRIEGIPLPRWLLAPRSSFTLHRHMVLWHVTSYHDGLRLEYDRMLAISHLQETYGRWLWRWKAPLRKRLALRIAPAEIALRSDDPTALTPATATGPIPAAATPAAASEPATIEPPDTQPAASAPKVIPPLAILGFLPKKHTVEIDPPATLPTQLNERDRQLVQAASAILRAAQDNGGSLSQAALARQLRAQGHAIANERLGWLIQAAEERPPPDGHQQHRGPMTPTGNPPTVHHDTRKPTVTAAPRPKPRHEQNPPRSCW